MNTQGGRYLRVLIGNVEASDEQLRLGTQRADCREIQSIMNPFAHQQPHLITFKYPYLIGGLGGNRFGVVLRNVEEGVTDAAIAEACEVNKGS